MIQFDTLLASENKDAVGIQGNIANSGVIGNDFFQKYIYDYEKKHADAIHQAGSFTVYHNCGKAKVLQKSYVKMGLTAWETIAEDPQGDSNLAEAKRDVGGEIVLIGNIDQVNFIKQASIEEIRTGAEEIVHIGKTGGKYIFACSDFLEKDTPLENVKAAIDAAKACGAY